MVDISILIWFINQLVTGGGTTLHFGWVKSPSFRGVADVFQVDVGLFGLDRGALQVLPYAAKGSVGTAMVRCLLRKLAIERVISGDSIVTQWNIDEIHPLVILWLCQNSGKLMNIAIQIVDLPRFTW